MMAQQSRRPIRTIIDEKVGMLAPGYDGLPMFLDDTRQSRPRHMHETMSGNPNRTQRRLDHRAAVPDRVVMTAIPGISRA